MRLQRAVDRDPGNPRLYELLGDVYDKQGEPTQALAQYAAAIKLNPTNAYYWDLEGGIYQKLGRLPEAETCFRQAIKVDPQYATALVALGNLEAKNQRFDDANKHYEEALRTHPTALDHSQPLTDLLGRSRAAVLQAAAHGGNTTQLADEADVLISSASQHLAVLRRAGLISSRRQANAVVHRVTPLGADLLGGARPVAPPDPSVSASCR